MNEKINELLKGFETLEKLEKLADDAEMAYDADCMNEEKENAFDAAYKRQYNCFMDCAGMLQDLINIDIKTARAMINGKREAVKEILRKAV